MSNSNTFFLRRCQKELTKQIVTLENQRNTALYQQCLLLGLKRKDFRLKDVAIIFKILHKRFDFGPAKLSEALAFTKRPRNQKPAKLLPFKSPRNYVEADDIILQTQAIVNEKRIERYQALSIVLAIWDYYPEATTVN